MVQSFRTGTLTGRKVINKVTITRARLPATTAKTTQRSAASWSFIVLACVVSRREFRGDNRVCGIPFTCFDASFNSCDHRNYGDVSSDRSTGLIRCRDTAGDMPPPPARHFSGTWPTRNRSQLIG